MFPFLQFKYLTNLNPDYNQSDFTMCYYCLQSNENCLKYWFNLINLLVTLHNKAPFVNISQQQYTEKDLPANNFHSETASKFNKQLQRNGK